MSAEIVEKVEALEGEAEKIIKEAEAQARKTLLEAREKAGRILSAEMPMAEVKAECEALILEPKQTPITALRRQEKKPPKLALDWIRR
jgi:cell division septum initiation protein DivIVA